MLHSQSLGRLSWQQQGSSQGPLLAVQQPSWNQKVLLCATEGAERGKAHPPCLAAFVICLGLGAAVVAATVNDVVAVRELYSLQ